jgi:hypothetical protein
VLAEQWQDRFDRLVLATAIVAIVGVALQTLARHGPLHVLGLIAAGLSWLVFALDAIVMLSVSPSPARWARGHGLELTLLVLTCPLWPVLLYRLLLLELLPALTVLEAAKLAKLAKVVYALRPNRRSRRAGTTPGRGRLDAAIVLIAAVAVAVVVVRR